VGAALCFAAALDMEAFSEITATISSGWGAAMKRLCFLCILCILLLGAGCASEGGKSQWDEFMKDLRGDNMKMRGDLSK
jgi:hypothetical protein